MPVHELTRLRSFAVQHKDIYMVWKVELEIKSVGLKSKRRHHFVVVILTCKEAFLPEIVLCKLTCVVSD